MDAIDVINRLLADRGETGAEMCRNLGLSNSIYSQWNTRKIKPSNRTLSVIAGYFGVSVSYLVNGEEKEPAPTDGDGLDPLDRRLVSLLPKLSQGQKKLLLTQLELTIQDNPE